MKNIVLVTFIFLSQTPWQSVLANDRSDAAAQSENASDAGSSNAAKKALDAERRRAKAEEEGDEKKEKMMERMRNLYARQAIASGNAKDQNEMAKWAAQGYTKKGPIRVDTYDVENRRIASHLAERSPNTSKEQWLEKLRADPATSSYLRYNGEQLVSPQQIQESGSGYSGRR